MGALCWSVGKLPNANGSACEKWSEWSWKQLLEVELERHWTRVLNLSFKWCEKSA